MTDGFGADVDMGRSMANRFENRNCALCGLHAGDALAILGYAHAKQSDDR